MPSLNGLRTVTVCRLEQPLNALLPIEVRLMGKLTLVILVFVNILTEIVVIPSGSTKLPVSPVSRNVLFPKVMFDVLGANVSDVRFEQSLNASSLIAVMFAGIVKLVSAVF
jgi:hypothetical protein